MVNYVRGPAYKSMKNLMGLNVPLVKSYIPNLTVWGVAVGGGIATFADHIPVFKETFYTKIPYFGDHWVDHTDPEDIPI